MAIRIGHMKITFTPRGILWAVWIKALFHEVCPETVNIRNVENQTPPLGNSIAVFEVQNRVLVFCAERCEIGVFATVDDLQSQDIFVEANGCPHVRNPHPGGENELYPRWQVGQYLQTKFTTHYDEIDNDRYPDLKWTSLADLVAQRP